jgi:hypothetical protein
MFAAAQNRYGFEHICHHERHSLLAVGLLTCLALTIERLYRVRYLQRGTHPVRAAIDLLLLLQRSLATSVPAVADSRCELPFALPPAFRLPVLLRVTLPRVDVSANCKKTGLENRPRLTMPLQSAVECSSSLGQTLSFVGIPKLLGRLQRFRIRALLPDLTL